jgi:hypothetical protein
MKPLQDYVGRLVSLRSAAFAALLARVRAHGSPPENRFLVGAVSARARKLVCYGGDLCLLVTPAEIELV